MFAFSTTDKTLIPVNDDPRVQAAREKTRTARAEVDRQETDEQRLRHVLAPPPESATTAPKEITHDMILEANSRLIPRRFGVTSPLYADTLEGNAARTACRAAQAEEENIRAEVRHELERHVRARAKALLNDLEDALAPCRKFAGELAALRDETEIPVPLVLSSYARNLIDNELNELRRFVNG
jgi:hypothetical protein